MEIMETVGFTNNFQDFCYEIHGSGQEAQQKPRSMGGGTIYIYIYGTPPQRPRFSYISIQSGRWGSQSEIDGMGLRVGGFRV